MRPWLFRGLKVLRLLLVALIVVVLLVGLVMTLPSTRSMVLEKVLGLVTGSLPGEMSVTEARWPRLGSIEIDGVIWTTPGDGAEVDTLAVVDRLVLELDIAALRGRSLGVRGLNLEVASLDVPAIARATAGDSAAIDRPTEGEPTPVPYFEEGSWPLFPAGFINELHISLGRGRITRELTLRGASLSGGVDLQRESGPRAWLSDSKFRMTSLSTDTLDLVVDELGLAFHVDPQAGTAVLDSLVLVIPEAGNRIQAPEWRAGGGARLEISGTASGGLVAGGQVALAGDFRLPGPGNFSGLLPDGFTLDARESGQGRFEVRGLVTEGLESIDSGSVRLEIVPNWWLERALVVGQFTRQTVQIDTCDVSLLGARVQASGTADSSGVDLECLAELADDRILQVFGGEALKSALIPDWQVNGGAWLDLTASARGGISQGGQVSVTGDFQLPGPGNFAGLLPEGFPLDAREAGQGHFDMRGRVTEGLESIDSGSVRLEIVPNWWLERALVVGQFTRQTVQVDTCDVSLLGARVQASGTADSLGVDLECLAELADGRILQMFGGEALKAVLIPDWQVNGGAWLDLTASARGGISQGGQVSVSGEFQLPGPGNFSGLVPDGFPIPGMDPGQGRFEAAVEVGGEFKSIDSGKVRLEVEPASWLERGLIAGRFTHQSVNVDTCDVSLLGARVQAGGIADSSQVDLTCLAELADGRVLQMFGGETFREAEGTANLQGHLVGPLQRPDLDLDFNANLQMSELVIPQGRLTARVHDDEVSVSVAAKGGLRLGSTFLDSLQARWDGSRLWDEAALGDFSQAISVKAWSPEMDLELEGMAGGDTLRVVRVDSLNLRLLDETASISEPIYFQYHPDSGYMSLQGFSLALKAGHLNLDGDYSAKGLDLAAAIDLKLEEKILQKISPNEIWSRDGGMALALKGQLDLGGTPEGPVFQGQMRVAAIPNRDNPTLAADAQFSLAQGEAAGLQADLRLSAGKIDLLKGSAIWPGEANLADGSWKPDPAKGFVVDIPEQKFALDQLNQFLPPDISLNGILNFFVRVNPDSTQANQVSGKIGTKDLRIELPNSSRLRMNTDLALAGNPVDPKVSGEINIQSGFFRIPEIPRNLLPVEGESLLWQAAIEDSSSVISDSLPVIVPEQGPVIDSGGPVFLPDLDLKINLPGRLAVHGYGLNVELEGIMRVTRGYDVEGIPGPAVKGNLGVANGTLKFMNRIFTFISSEVEFRGEVPVNPRLKVVLESDISGYLVRLSIEGTGLDPQIIMTAEPELKEADIMALLIFGQTASDLDSDQRGRMRDENDPKQQLQQNMAALAVVMGTSGMSNTMSQTLGVDMVELGADSEGDSTLMVGKYLSSRILVKYNQSLEKSGTYFMTLDYSINKFFKLVSTYGQGEEDSGVEVRWTRRY